MKSVSVGVSVDTAPREFIQSMSKQVREACEEFHAPGGIGQKIEECLIRHDPYYNDLEREFRDTPKYKGFRLLRSILWRLCKDNKDISEQKSIAVVGGVLEGLEKHTHGIYNLLYSSSIIPLFCGHPCVPKLNNELVFRMLKYNVDYLTHLNRHRSSYGISDPYVADAKSTDVLVRATNLLIRLISLTSKP